MKLKPFKSPFNKVVRSHEALFLGLLLGFLLGLVAIAFIPVVVDKDVYENPVSEALCGKMDNIEYVRFDYLGRLQEVKCKDGRVLNSF